MNSKMFNPWKEIFLVLTLCVAAALGDSPHIGYLYPAGGQQGSVVYVAAGGQFLKGASDVYVSGQGVHAKVVKYYRPVITLKKEEQQLIQQRLKEVQDKRLKELGINSDKVPGRDDSQKPKPQNGSSKQPSQLNGKKSLKAVNVKMPEHPLLEGLEDKNLLELAHIRYVLFSSSRTKQKNRQLAESVLIKITIDKEAQPGNRELRIVSPIGLTNPIVFQVGQFPEILELEPNNRKLGSNTPLLTKLLNNPNLPKTKPIELPAVLNGQIMPGDSDRFRFNAKEGQKLVIETHARSLIPYLADAVPGWFQATLALYDNNDNEAAFVDDYRFNPDPVLFYEITKTGEYELEIRDSVYRGREDFVYRIAIGEQPFVTQVFPLGGKSHSKTVVSIDGWNLAQHQLSLNTWLSANNIQHTTYNRDKLVSNPITYAVDALDEAVETESNNSAEEAQPVTLPVIINGQIDKSGDVDIFKFEGSSGDKVVAEVYGRRLNSPLDSLLRLGDANGTTIEWNDDHITKDGQLHEDITGLVTHQADSYVMATLPQDGSYYVYLADSQNRGGPEYAYRLRIAKPQGDFALRVTPSSLFTFPGGIVEMNVHVLRKDGFDGKIEIVLKDAPAGFELNGGIIPAGCNQIRMTLAVPKDVPEKPVALELQGRAAIGGRMVSHLAVPAEDMMQAFLYRHLVESQQLLIAFQKKNWSSISFKWIDTGPVSVLTETPVRVHCKINGRKIFSDINLELSQPPQGLTLHDVKVDSGEVSFNLKADKNLRSTGFISISVS